jgi:hypothetical protein
MNLTNTSSTSCKIRNTLTHTTLAARVSSKKGAKKGAEVEQTEPYLAALLDQGQSLVRAAAHCEPSGKNSMNMNIRTVVNQVSEQRLGVTRTQELLRRSVRQLKESRRFPFYLPLCRTVTTPRFFFCVLGQHNASDFCWRCELPTPLYRTVTTT